MADEPITYRSIPVTPSNQNNVLEGEINNNGVKCTWNGRTNENMIDSYEDRFTGFTMWWQFDWSELKETGVDEVSGHITVTSPQGWFPPQKINFNFTETTGKAETNIYIEARDYSCSVVYEYTLYPRRSSVKEVEIKEVFYEEMFLPSPKNDTILVVDGKKITYQSSEATPEKCVCTFEKEIYCNGIKSTWKGRAQETCWCFWWKIDWSELKAMGIDYLSGHITISSPQGWFPPKILKLISMESTIKAETNIYIGTRNDLCSAIYEFTVYPRCLSLEKKQIDRCKIDQKAIQHCSFPQMLKEYDTVLEDDKFNGFRSQWNGRTDVMSLEGCGKQYTGFTMWWQFDWSELKETGVDEVSGRITVTSPEGWFPPHKISFNSVETTGKIEANVLNYPTDNSTAIFYELIIIPRSFASEHAEYPDTFGSPSTSSSSGVDPNDQRPQQSLVRPLCKVCGDRSLGINYGVVSCSACKKFFYRAIENWHQKIEKCKYRGYKCSVNIANRTKCLACRLKKCLEVGMTRVAKHLDGGLNLVLDHFRTVDPSFSAPEYVEPVEGFEEEEDKENMEWEEDEESAQKVQESITIPAESWTDGTWNATDMNLAELNNDRYDDDDNTMLAQDSHEPSNWCNEWNYDDDQGFDAIPESEDFQLRDPSSSQTMSEAGPEKYYDRAYLMEHSQELTVVGHSSMDGSSSSGPTGTGTGGRTQTVKEYIESMSLQNSHPSASPPEKPKRPVHQAQQNKAPASPKPLLFSRYGWDRPPRDLNFLGEHSNAKKSDDPYCKVCSAPANRSYFGVKACENCKTAFAEYVVVAKPRPMECGTNGKGATCDSCEYCHFQKCVRAGMRKEISRQQHKNQTCKVCFNDKTIQNHYGVETCVACSMFFYRAIENWHQKIEKCKYRGYKCTVNVTNRTKCQACRLKKCLEVGMTRVAKHLDGGLNLVLDHFRTVDPSFSAPEYVEPVEGFEEEEDKENMEREEDEESAQKVQESITIPAEAWTKDTWNATDMTLAELNNDRYDDDDISAMVQNKKAQSFWSKK